MKEEKQKIEIPKDLDLKEFSVFGSKPKDSILIPNTFTVVRNNCQSGQWVIGETDYGSKCSMSIVKFQKFYGDLGQTSGEFFGQVWFVVEPGSSELPQGCVLVTYIKTASYDNLNELNTKILCDYAGMDPAAGIYTPNFVKHNSQKPDENGISKPISYYSLNWSWRPRETSSEWDYLRKIVSVFGDKTNREKLVDYKSTARMICIDSLPEAEQQKLYAAVNNQNFNLPLISGSKQEAKEEKEEDEDVIVGF